MTAAVGQEPAAADAARAALAGLFTMACVMGIGRFVYTPILPWMIDAGALGAKEAGLVAGANFLGYLAGALAASMQVFQLRPRLWMLAGVALSIVTTAAMGLAAGLAPMMVIRFLSGLASAFGMIFVTALVLARLASARRPELISYHFGGVGIGIAVSAFLVARLAGAGIEWQGQWLWAGALAAGSAAAALALLPARDPVITTAGVDRKVEKFGLPLIILTIGYGLFGFGYVITATFINAMAKTVPQLQPVEPWVWMVVGLSGLPSLILWNRLARVTGYSLAYTLACLVEAAGVMLSVLVQTPAALVASAVMLGGTFMALSALGFNLARSMEGGSQGRAIALMTASFGVGQMAGPVVAGFLFETSGDLFAASMLAGGALVAAALLTVASSIVSGPLKTA